MNKKFTVVIANPTEPIGLGMACFGGVITAAYDRELSNAQTAVDSEHHTKQSVVQLAANIADALPVDEPAPLVRLTDAEIFSVWSSHCENTKTKGGFNPCIFGHDVIDAMIEKNKGGSYENKS